MCALPVGEVHLDLDVHVGGAVAAQRRLKEGQGDEDYAHSRIEIARFFAETVLSQAPGKLDSIRVGYECLPDDLALGIN